MFQPEVKPGTVVRHKKFGIGKVALRFGEDELSKVIVKFQEEGEKKLALKQAKLEVDAPEPEPVPEDGTAPAGA
jgi:hypothetical protein